MKRGGAFQGSQVQQMLGGSHSGWWSRSSDMRPLPQQISPFLPPSSSSPSPSSSSPSCPPPFPSGCVPLFPWPENQDHIPDQSWNQLLIGGQIGEEEKSNNPTTFPTRKVEINWEDQAPYQHPTTDLSTAGVKHESAERGYVYGFAGGEETQAPAAAAARCSWGQLALPVSSPKSCVTFGSNMLDFSGSKVNNSNPRPDHSTECNSTETAGSAPKKARVQGSSSAAQSSPFKVRKEKLGDRITVLHQLVSPFGKTDTASVLLEAIGYIRFLQSQIGTWEVHAVKAATCIDSVLESPMRAFLWISHSSSSSSSSCRQQALSSPYLGNAAAQGNASHGHAAGQGETCCIFPEDPGQLLNDACMKIRGAAEKDEPKKDLKSRGLCLVPISCTMHVSSDNAADYWAPALGGGYR